MEITSQNHGFAVDGESLPAELEVTHVNLNDNTVEGMRHRSLPAFSVQYHPEASAGPHDSSYLFAQFREMLPGRTDAMNPTLPLIAVDVGNHRIKLGRFEALPTAGLPEPVATLQILGEDPQLNRIAAWLADVPGRSPGGSAA